MSAVAQSETRLSQGRRETSFIAQSIAYKLGLLLCAVMLAGFPLLVSAAGLYFSSAGGWADARGQLMDEVLFFGIGMSISAIMELAEVNWDCTRYNEPRPNVGNVLGVLSIVAAIACLIELCVFYIGEEEFATNSLKARALAAWMPLAPALAAAFAVLGQLAFTYRKAHRFLERRAIKTIGLISND